MDRRIASDISKTDRPMLLIFKGPRSARTPVIMMARDTRDKTVVEMKNRLYRFLIECVRAIAPNGNTTK